MIPIVMELFSYFLVESFSGNFYSHLVTFCWSHCNLQQPLASLNEASVSTYSSLV